MEHGSARTYGASGHGLYAQTNAYSSAAPIDPADMVCVLCTRLLVRAGYEQPTARCNHHLICLRCLANWLTRHRFSGWPPCRYCPLLSCRAIMTDNDVQRVLAASRNAEEVRRRAVLAAYTPLRDVLVEDVIEGDTDSESFSTPSLSERTPLPASTFPSAERTRACVVCLDNLPLSDFPHHSPTPACAHQPTACRSCLSQHIQSRINDSISAIPCPTCSAPLEFDDVRRCVSREAFDNYDALLLRQGLSGAKEFVWCLNPACGAGQLHLECEGEVIVTCASCGAKSCYVHQMPWHTGLTCEEFDEVQRRTDEGAEADDAYLRSYTKSCPRCNIAIQKSAGCDHMTCQPPGGCGYQFCWSCLADWGTIMREGNHRHRRECAFYTPLPGSAEGTGRRNYPEEPADDWPWGGRRGYGAY